jgi:hypothetical protein
MRLVLASIGLALLACGSQREEGTAGTGAGGAGGSGPVPTCSQATPWKPGKTVFKDATESWGLKGVEGTRIQAIDFDGDGWTDLLVRSGAAAGDDFGTIPACCADKSCPMGTSCSLRHTWLLRNDRKGRFEDVTKTSGIVTTRGDNGGKGRPSSVWAFADVDNDGDVDAYSGLAEPSGSPQTETSEILLNQGNGTFALGPATSGIRVENGDGPAAASFVDVDRNGTVDLFVPQSLANHPRQERLYAGDGKGGFQDVTAAVGMMTKSWPGEPIGSTGQASIDDLNKAKGNTIGWGGVACDLNGDGDAELLSSSYGRSPNHLWQSNGGQFINRSVESGYAFDERVDWRDNESARCWCKLHPTDQDCAGVPAPMFIKCEKDADAFRWQHQFDRNPFRLGGNSGSTICGDVDNDGDLDLLTSEIVHWDVGTTSDPSELLFNDGAKDVKLSRPGNDATGLTRKHDGVDWNDGDITGSLFDFDNDGLLDVVINSTDYPGTRLLLFHNLGKGKFEPVPSDQGIDHKRSHGIAVADFDRDGDLDVVVGHSLARCGGSNDCGATPQIRLFQNELAQGTWVQLSLAGTGGSNRLAIGARVTVATPDGVTRTQEVGGGHGHYGQQNDFVLHFGLGTACSAQVKVRYPDKMLTTQEFDVNQGKRYRIVQGSAPETVSN